MNVFVLIKQVPDTEAMLSVKNGTSINEESIKWIISPYDEYALEEALKLKEKDAEVVVNALTLGPQRVESALRSALAMGADNGIHIVCEEDLDIETRARMLAEAIKKESDTGLVFIGKQAIDDDSNQTHILVAEYLDMPVTTNIISFKLEGDKVTCEREIEDGDVETVEMNTPCAVTASKVLNTPRYASLMGIMKAKKIELKKI
ncbi:MAG: electron transfer flavoprotein subunit beta/FixA family protein, partial [Candidatus Aminicenantes bacterium]|nr:electron transfer flavoprotein subunit beta/FixA family protein [Candidatus Aminicenantes bacterium]